jgi:hypothetical protein
MAPRIISGSPVPPRVKRVLARADMLAKAGACARQSRKSGSEALSRPMVGWRPQIRITRSGWRNGRGRSSTPSTALKMAVLAPMPSASVSIAVRAKTGCCRSERSA